MAENRSAPDPQAQSDDQRFFTPGTQPFNWDGSKLNMQGVPKLQPLAPSSSLQEYMSQFALPAPYYGLNNLQQTLEKLESHPETREHFQHLLNSFKCGAPPTPDVLEDIRKTMEKLRDVGPELPGFSYVPPKNMPPEAYMEQARKFYGQQGLIDEVIKATHLPDPCPQISSLPPVPGKGRTIS